MDANNSKFNVGDFVILNTDLNSQTFSETQSLDIYTIARIVDADNYELTKNKDKYKTKTTETKLNMTRLNSGGGKTRRKKSRKSRRKTNRRR